ncbi:MAG TPA: hypothetical protein VLC46_17575 [Thermoanaerobaculia bacterium]|nr:hypothetical protein [Thermoanaerobaculia bacterium]
MTTTPVKVTVISETATKQLVDDVRKAALTNIEKQVPNARPMTVTATLYVVYTGTTGFNHRAVYSGESGVMAYGNFGSDVATGRQVAEIGPNPGQNGFTPVVGVGGMPGVVYPGVSPTTIRWMRLSYTIADANGRVIESKDEWQPADRPRNAIERIFPSIYDGARVADTGAFLASRVAALSR